MLVARALSSCLVLTVLLLLGQAAGCDPCVAPRPDRGARARSGHEVSPAGLAAVRRREHELVVYYSWDDHTARVVLEAFARQHGIAVGGMRRSSRHVVKIIEAERRAPVASVVMGGSAASHEMLERAGLLLPYIPAGSAVISAEFKDPGGAWTGIYLGALGFGTDPSRSPIVPRTYDDLLRVGSAAGVVYANPATSGTAYTFLLGLIATRGEDGAFDFLVRLHPSVVEVPSAGAMAVRLVALRQAGVAIAFAHDIVETRLRSGSRLELSFPEEGTSWEVGGASLLRGAPSPGWGRRFLDYLVLPRTQEMFWREGRKPVYPTHPEAASPPGMPPFASIRRLPLDMEAAGRLWDRRALRWNRMVGRR